jgi:DNA adenine methylase
MRQICVDNALLDGVYVEPYAGGAAIGMELLQTGYVRELRLNDIDPAIYSFWKATIDHSEEMISMVRDVPLTVAEWRRQRDIYRRSDITNILTLGFATLFLNRTNRSGILSGGLIGGLRQKGNWLIDARFNRPAIVERLQRIAQYRRRVHVSCDDAEVFLRKLKLPDRALVYVDPPYFHKGQRLYRNHYEAADHARVADLVQNLRSPWIVSYDDVQPISRLYRKRRKLRYSLQYSAHTNRQGGELLIFCDRLTLPKTKNPGEYRVN